MFYTSCGAPTEWIDEHDVMLWERVVSRGYAWDSIAEKLNLNHENSGERSERGRRLVASLLEI